jgi:hypothetical protein
MSSDTQFTALGPASVGFQTDGANINKGVEATGRIVGVHGIGAALDPPGGSNGVTGETPRGIGVTAFAQFGVGVNAQSNGPIKSFPNISPNTPRPGPPATGVDALAIDRVGTTEGDDRQGIGVRATGGSTGVRAFGDEFGVRAEGGKGTGIEAIGHSGPGVLGSGKDGNRGGIFQSATDVDPSILVPQLQLVPQTMKVAETQLATPKEFIPKNVSGLPKFGRAGDFLATLDSNQSCTLWFCVHGNDGEGPAQWSQVLLGDIVKGGA